MTQDKTKHTPTPWYLTEGAANEQHVQSAVLNEDNYICLVEGRDENEAHANAAFIVLACNTHEMAATLIRRLHDSESIIAAATPQEIRAMHDVMVAMGIIA